MSQSQILFALQKIDTKIDGCKNRINEIDILLTGNDELRQAEIALVNAQEQLDIELKILRTAEQRVQDQYVKIAQTEAALYGGKIRIPKELQDLQNEAVALKRYLETLEDRQLESMISVETAQLQYNNAEDAFNQVNAAWIEQKASLCNELSQLHAQIDRLESERIAALSPIPQDLLVVYQNLRKQRNGVAVVVIMDKSCAACGTTLTPAVLQATQSSLTITRCPTCNRILYS